MAQRRRKHGRRQRPAPRAAQPPSGRPAESPAASRSEQRNAAVRASLTPLAPGERPWPLKVAVVLAFLTGAVQLVLFAAGVKLKVAGVHAKAGPTIVFAALMFMCAAGMWTLRYWALLGFMALLGITVTSFALALVKVSSLVGLVISLAGVAGGGYLFWKLVRVLSRIQMPKYPGR